MTGHLELETLADVLAGESAPAHLAECAECAAALDELRAADALVAAALRTLPAPPLPAGLADRLDAALGALRPAAAVTTLPAARAARQVRWLPAAAAAVVLLGGIGVGVTQLRDRTDDAGSGDTAATLAAPQKSVVRNETGNAYTGRADLTAAVPGLLAGAAADSARIAAAPNPNAPQLTGGGAQAESADPLARLRGDDALAECLAALLPPEDPSVRPLALDLGTFKGAPAMVAVLPGAVTGKLDVYVVGPSCSRADAAVLFYASVDAP